MYVTTPVSVKETWGVLILLFCMQIHGTLIGFPITLQWMCEKLLGAKNPKFSETSTPPDQPSIVMI